MITLTRAHQSYRDIWKIGLRSRLPVIPIPLLEPDPDVLLDLQKVLEEVFDGLDYDYDIDYSQAPPPPKLEEDWKWLKTLVQK